MATNPALTLACVLLLSVASALMYEDEQGQKDWRWVGLGYVTHASIHAGKSLKSIYTISDGNTIAALRIKAGGEVRWKRVLGRDEQLGCLAHTDSSVVAGALGSQTILYFDAKDGQTTSASALPKSDGELTMMQCAATSSGLIVATLHVERGTARHVVRLYRTELEVGFDAESLLSEHVFDKAVSTLTIDEAATYVTSAAGTVLIPNKKGAAKEPAPNPESIPSGPNVVCDTDGSQPALKIGGKEIKELECFPQEPPVAVGWSTKSSKGVEAVVRTHDGHIHYCVDAVVQWSRPEGLSAVAKVSFAELASGNASSFGFDQRIVAVSRFGRVYSLLTTPSSAGAPEWTFDLKGLLYTAHWTQLASQGTQFEPLSVEAHTDEVRILLRVGATAVWVSLDSTNGDLRSSALDHEFAHTVGPGLVLHRDEMGALRSTVAANQETRFFVVDEAKGAVQGYIIGAGQTAALPLWKVALGVPIAASATAASSEVVQTADTIRLFPNTTTKQLEVRNKYSQMANLLILAHFEEVVDEPPTLHLTAVDTVTGNVISSIRHANVDGRVRIVVAEHVVYYHLLNVKLMRYYVGVWEVFERTDFTVTDATFANPAQIAVSALAKQRVVSAFNARPPVVAAQLLLFPQDVQALGLTVTLDGIARKQALFVTSTGQLVAVDLKQLSFGYHEEGKPDPLTAPMNQVIIPSISVLSYSHVLHKPTAVVSAPTLLESTTHVLVLGQDLFYVRTASGKPFDILNADFARQPLLLVCAGFVLATGLLRFLAQRKALKSQWE